MAEKLHQNRGVIIGATVGDAATYRDRVAEDDVVYVATSHLKPTILGSLAGLHVRTAYITPHASSGLNYDLAIEAVERVLAKTGGELLHFASRD